MVQFPVFGATFLASSLLLRLLLLAPTVVVADISYQPWEREPGYGPALSRVGSYYNGTLSIRYDHRNLTTGALADNPDFCEHVPSPTIEYDAMLFVGVPNPSQSRDNPLSLALIAWSQRYSSDIVGSRDTMGDHHKWYRVNSEGSTGEPFFVLESALLGTSSSSSGYSFSGRQGNNSVGDIYLNFTDACHTGSHPAPRKKYLADALIGHSMTNDTSYDGTPTWPTLVEGTFDAEDATFTHTASVTFVGEEDFVMKGNLTMSFEGVLDGPHSDDLLPGHEVEEEGVPEWERTVGSDTIEMPKSPGWEDDEGSGAGRALAAAAATAMVYGMLGLGVVVSLAL